MHGQWKLYTKSSGDGYPAGGGKREQTVGFLSLQWKWWEGGSKKEELKKNDSRSGERIFGFRIVVETALVLVQLAS